MIISNLNTCENDFDIFPKLKLNTIFFKNTKNYYIL